MVNEPVEKALLTIESDSFGSFWSDIIIESFPYSLQKQDNPSFLSLDVNI
jgi:hypothetical protein